MQLLGRTPSWPALPPRTQARRERRRYQRSSRQTTRLCIQTVEACPASDRKRAWWHPHCTSAEETIAAAASTACKKSRRLTPVPLVEILIHKRGGLIRHPPTRSTQRPRSSSAFVALQESGNDPGCVDP